MNKADWLAGALVGLFSYPLMVSAEDTQFFADFVSCSGISGALEERRRDLIVNQQPIESLGIEYQRYEFKDGLLSLPTTDILFGVCASYQLDCGNAGEIAAMKQGLCSDKVDPSTNCNTAFFVGITLDVPLEEARETLLKQTGIDFTIERRGEEGVFVDAEIMPTETQLLANAHLVDNDGEVVIYCDEPLLGSIGEDEPTAETGAQ